MVEQAPSSAPSTSSMVEAPEIVQAAETPTFKVYKPSSTDPVHIQQDDVPESYYTPTAADLKSAQATLSARTQALNNAPLQLRSHRETAEKLKRDRWPNTTIRIKFTDRTQVEKTFSSTDKIRSVYAFVRSSLRDDVKPIKFILYQSPPKRDLKVSDPQVRDLNLTELHLSPSSVLLIRFEDESLNASDVPAPLLPSIISQATDLPPPPNFEVGSSQQASQLPAPKLSEPTSRLGEKKIPKWLKVGLKK